MMADVKQLYFWKGMKGDFASFEARCLDFQRLKVEYHHPISLLYPHNIIERKWQVISMEFMQGFPMSRKKHNSILLVVDKLTKVAHFIPENLTDGAPVTTRKIVQEVFRLHGILENYFR